MAIHINSISTLQHYIQGVLERAAHHAGNVEGVSLTLLGVIIATNTGEIYVREYAGQPANIIWFSVNENRYAMVYNHEKQAVELKERNQNGVVLKAFDNNTPYQDIIAAFSNL